jgi:formate hydrogenlyase subunit 6/NADH:ubiquinone oxidoreductase subunit I
MSHTVKFTILALDVHNVEHVLQMFLKWLFGKIVVRVKLLTEDCVGCKRCESACPTDFLSVRVYLGEKQLVVWD